MLSSQNVRASAGQNAAGAVEGGSQPADRMRYRAETSPLQAPITAAFIGLLLVEAVRWAGDAYAQMVDAEGGDGAGAAMSLDLMAAAWRRLGLGDGAAGPFESGGGNGIEFADLSIEDMQFLGSEAIVVDAATAAALGQVNLGDLAVTVEGLTFNSGGGVGFSMPDLTGLGLVDEFSIPDIDDTLNPFGEFQLGTSGDDVLVGTDDDDVLLGLDGDDLIFGLDGDDVIEGGNGNDTIDAGGGNDRVTGDAGDDVISGGGGNDFLDGGEGNDRIDGGSGSDTVQGGGGSDTLSGGPGGEPVVDNLWGYNDNDVYYVNSPSDVPTGEGSFSDLGDVAIFTPAFASVLNDGPLYLWNDDAQSAILQNGYIPSNTYALQSGVENIIVGGDFDAHVYGNNDANAVFGNAGANWLYGLDGNDQLQGAGGSDWLEGGGGDDNLAGGTGADILAGGLGNDRYVFALGETGSDSIVDYQGINTLAFTGAAGDGLSLSIEGADLVAFWQGSVRARVVDYTSSGAIFQIETQEGTYALAPKTTNAAPELGVGLAGIPDGIESTAYGWKLPDNAFVDPDGGALTVQAVDLPAFMSFNPVTQTLSGTPGDAAAGTYEVVFRATDPGGLSVETTATFEIAAKNDAPSIEGELPPATVGAGAVLASTFSVEIADADQGDTHSVELRSADGAALPSWLDWSYDPTTGEMSLGGTAPDAGVDLALAVVVTDSGGAAATAPLTLTVIAAPVAEADAMQLDAGTGATLNVLANDTGAGGLSIAAPQSFQTASGLQVNLASDGTMTVQAGETFRALGAGDSATETVSYEAVDGFGQSVTGSVSIEIAGVNDAPVTGADNATLAAGTDIAVDVLANDTDPDQGDTLSLVGVEAPASGTSVTVQGDSIIYDPGELFSYLAAGERFSETVTYTVEDDTGVQTEGTLNVTVVGTEDRPLVVDDAFAVDAGVVTSLDVLANDFDPDGGALNVVAAAGWQSDLGAALSVAANGEIVYDSGAAFKEVAAGEVVVDRFDYAVQDGSDTVTGTAEVTVTGINDAPETTGRAPETLIGTAGTAFAFAAAPLFSDADSGDVLTYSATSANGTSLPAWLSVDPQTGAVTGTGEAGLWELTLTATDEAGASVSQSLSLDVTPAASAPPIAALPLDANGDFAPSVLANADGVVATVTNQFYNFFSDGEAAYYLEGGDRAAADSGYTKQLDGAFSMPDGEIAHVELTGNRPIEIIGDAADNIILGNSADNRLVGGAGNDILGGGDGDDELIGGDGDDSLAGGFGSDILDGGEGADVYHLGLNDGGVDFIFDSDGGALIFDGVDQDSISFAQNGDDLTLSVEGTDRAVIADTTEADVAWGESDDGAALLFGGVAFAQASLRFEVAAEPMADLLAEQLGEPDEPDDILSEFLGTGPSPEATAAGASASPAAFEPDGSQDSGSAAVMLMPLAAAGAGGVTAEAQAGGLGENTQDDAYAYG